MHSSPYEPPVELNQPTADSFQDSVFLTRILFVAGLALGFFAAPQLLTLAAFLSGLPIAGLPCTPGWREAVHAISYTACLYPLFLIVATFLVFIRVPRTWAFCTTAIPIGFTAYLIWMTSTGDFPTQISSITPRPGSKQFVIATVHGLSHVFLIPIGIHIGERIMKRKRPRFHSVDYLLVTVLLSAWTFATVHTQTTFQHDLIRWLSLATAFLLSLRTLERKPGTTTTIAVE